MSIDHVAQFGHRGAGSEQHRVLGTAVKLLG